MSLLMPAPQKDYLVCETFLAPGNGEEASLEIIDWHQTLPRIFQLATQLELLPVDKVALCFDDSYQFFIALMATFQAEKQPILLPNNLPGTLQLLATEYQSILTDQAEIAVIQKEGGHCPVILLDQMLFDCQLSFDACEWHALSDAQTLILFTSGSTGKPKKVLKTLASIFSEVNDLSQMFNQHLQNSLFVASVSHQHLYGLLFKIFLPFVRQQAFLNQQIRFPEDILSHRKTVFISSPALLKRLEVVELKDSHVSALFSSGGPLDLVSAKKTLSVFDCHAYEIFGSTETGGIAVRQQLKDSEWQPLPNVQVKQHESKRLWLKSQYEGSNEWLLCDDLITLNDKGTFSLKGRIDRIIKLEEKRISLNLLENLITIYVDKLIKNKFKQQRLPADLSYKSDNIFIKVLDFNLKDRKFLGVVMQSNVEYFLTSKEIKTLKEYLLNHVERIAVPKRWRFVTEIPLNAQGKIEYQALRQLLCENKSNQSVGVSV